MQLLKNTALRFMVPGYFPLDNCYLDNCPPWNPPRAIDPRTFPFGKLPLDISPWTTTSRATFPYKIPPKEITLQTLAIWIITPERIPSWTIPPWISDPPWNSFHGNLPLDFWPWTEFCLGRLPLNNFYRWRSKKGLFTHSSLEILNKFRKKIKQGAVHATSWRCFTS